MKKVCPRGESDKRQKLIIDQDKRTESFSGFGNIKVFSYFDERRLNRMVKAKARLEQVEEKIRGEMEMASMSSYLKEVYCRRAKIRKRLTWLFF